MCAYSIRKWQLKRIKGVKKNITIGPTEGQTSNQVTFSRNWFFDCWLKLKESLSKSIKIAITWDANVPIMTNETADCSGHWLFTISVSFYSFFSIRFKTLPFRYSALQSIRYIILFSFCFAVLVVIMNGLLLHIVTGEIHQKWWLCHNHFPLCR